MALVESVKCICRPRKIYDPPGFEPLYERVVGTKGIAVRDHMRGKTRLLTEVAIERELAEAMAYEFVHGESPVWMYAPSVAIAIARLCALRLPTPTEACTSNCCVFEASCARRGGVDQRSRGCRARRKNGQGGRVRRSPSPPGCPSGTFRLESRFSATAGRADMYTVIDPAHGHTFHLQTLYFMAEHDRYHIYSGGMKLATALRLNEGVRRLLQADTSEVPKKPVRGGDWAGGSHKQHAGGDNTVNVS